MSPRAAWRLERLGFDAYDYAAGKVDWLASGQPTVRATADARRALDAVDREPPTCSPDTRVSALPDVTVLVVNAERILLGRVRPDNHPPTATAEDVMEPGPTTVRAHEPLDELLDRMRAHSVAEIAVTTPEGRLIGLVRSE